MGFAYPISTEDEAKHHIQNLRDLHPKAVHVCFAWRIGIHNYSDRYSDDGEPNNSAGKPIFGQILAYELTNVCVAVVRYYGGTKLGVGGLINAYKTAAKECFESARIIEKFEEQLISITFHPEHTGELMSRLNKLGANIEHHGFENDLHSVRLRIRKSNEDRFIGSFENSNRFKIELMT